VAFLDGEIRKGIAIIIEVCITSLNSHFASSRFDAKYGSWISRAKV